MTVALGQMEIEKHQVWKRMGGAVRVNAIAAQVVDRGVAVCQELESVRNARALTRHFHE